MKKSRDFYFSLRIRPGVHVTPQRHCVRRFRHRRWREVWLSPTQFRMVTVVAGSQPYGITLDRLFDVIYAGTEPPLTGKKSLSVQRNIINRKLKLLGVSISTPGAGRRGGTYELKVAP